MKIIHCFRSPVGGIFRHVRDLLQEQVSAGHKVGFLCDSTTGGDYENQLFDQIKPNLELGLHRIAMSRSISPKDPITLWKTGSILRSIRPDIVHSHSAKGGVYGRLGAWLASSGSHSIKTYYCPHGGAMHYDAKSLKGCIFFAAERFLERYSNSLIFISNYEKDAYHHKVGIPRCPESVVYNGLATHEFKPVFAEKNAVDFLYIGMMRDLKGPDIFIEALKLARDKSGKKFTAWFVGDGDDKDKYISQIKSLDLEEAVTTHPAMPAREAFAKANIVVVPSRAESLPYLVLEAMAAQKPIICTDVGGIHEIFADDRNRLLAPNDPKLMADAMIAMAADKNRQSEAKRLAETLKGRFSVAAMAKSMEAVYLR